MNSCEVNPFSQDEQMQISIICPQPYFKAIDEVVADISNVTPLFTFPFSINVDEPILFSSYEENKITVINNLYGDKTGGIIQIDVLEDVDDILIRNTITGDSFELVYDFEAGDRITINTNSGEKSVKLTRDSVTTSIFSAIVSGSVFLQLEAGENLFGFKVDNGAHDDDVKITFSYYSAYRGV